MLLEIEIYFHRDVWTGLEAISRAGFSSMYVLVAGWGMRLPDIVSSIYKYQMGIIGRSIN